MIDPLQEELITPAQATKLYPHGPNGRQVHVSRVYRDMLHGQRGIVLESVLTPKLATSREAVARFFRRLTEASRSGQPSPRIEKTNESANHEVERELDRLGL